MTLLRLSPQLGVHVVVHGDDFTALGVNNALDMYEKGLQQHFDLKLRGRPGDTENDLCEIRVLNKMLRVVPASLRCEADPRHSELLIRSLNIARKRTVATPGVKWSDDLDHGPVDSEHVSAPSPQAEFDVKYLVGAVIVARGPQLFVEEIKVDGVHQKRQLHFQFAQQPTLCEAPPSSEVYGAHLHSFMFTGPVLGTIDQPERFATSPVKQLSPLANPFTGKVAATMDSRLPKQAKHPDYRLHALRNGLVDGAGWGISTADRLDMYCTAISNSSNPSKRDWERKGSRASRS